MNVTILNVVNNTKTDKNGKPFQIAEVAYKNNTFGGKVEGFKVTSFMGAYKDIVSANPGTTLDVEVKKNGQFNEWAAAKAASPMGNSNAAGNASVGHGAGAPSAGGTGFSKAGNTYGKDFETKEERAKKQVYIVRQSSVSAAVSSLSVGAKAALKPEDVIALAKVYEGYVFDTGSVSNETGFDDVPNFDDPQFNN